jgi:hypothetical protein
MRFDTLQTQIDDIAAERRKQETDAQRTALAPEQAEALRAASATIEDILIGVLAGQNARTDALISAVRSRLASEEDERRQRLLEMSVQLDEAREANDGLLRRRRSCVRRSSSWSARMSISGSSCRGLRA